MIKNNSKPSLHIKNIAVVGCGHWGKNLVRNFSELGALAAICDPDKNLAEKFASEYNVKNLNYEEIINSEFIEGIVLAVPASLHASMAVEAMNAKKHVYVEKPLAMNRDEAEKMIEVANKNRVKLMVGHLLQYHPIFKTIKNLHKSGEIGNISYLYSNRLSFGKVRTQEDVIWSFAPHDISMILSLVNEDVKSVNVDYANIIQENISDIATLHLEFSSGLKSHISISWLHPYKEQKLVVIGELAMVVFDDTKPWKEKLAIYKHKYGQYSLKDKIDKSEVEYLCIPESEPLKNECKHFIDVVNDNLTPYTDGFEGLRVLNVLSAASKSVKISSKVNLEKI